MVLVCAWFQESKCRDQWQEDMNKHTKTEHLDKNYLQRRNNRSSKIEHFSAFTSQEWPVHDWKSYAWDTHHALMLPRLSFSAVSHNQGAKNQVNQYERDHWGCDSFSTGKEEQKADQCLKNYLKAMAMTRTIWLINKKIETTKNKQNFEYIFNQLISTLTWKWTIVDFTDLVLCQKW